jgi:hypothetical protein
MSRTYRNLEGMHRGALRFPHTFNEIRQLDGFLREDGTEEFRISKLNRSRSRRNMIPTAWDDRVVSGYEQQDYNKN